MTRWVAGPNGAPAGRHPITGMFHLDGFGADLTGATDCTTQFQAAVNAAKAVGGTVYVPEGASLKHRSIDVSNTLGLAIRYAPYRQTSTVVAGSTTVNALFYNTGAVKSLTIDGLNFTGSVVDDVTVPRRSRTYSGTQVNAAVIINGSLDPNNTYPAASDVRVNNCDITGTSSLPVLLNGISGVARVSGCRFRLTMDVGWTHNERAECYDNTSIKSADNGFSLSRGNQSVRITGNFVRLCAYNAYFAAGFLTDKGPNNIVIGNNGAVSPGLAGIYLDSASKYATITGNDLEGAYYRGPSDNLTDSGCVGIFIGGYPLDNRAVPTDWADGVVVTGNHIRAFARAGIFMTGVRNSLINGNKVDDIGTQYLADGSTTISAADQTQNVGILVDQATTSSNLVISNNHVTDARTTPYCNWAIVPVGSSVANEFFNTMVGCRNAYNLVETGPTRNINWGAVFQTQTIHTAGGRAGSTAGSGTIAGFDINGAAGSVRRHKILTAAAERWQYGGDGTAESGSNVGTDFVVNSYTDAGAFLATTFRVRRSDSRAQFAGPVLLLAVATGSRPSASVAGAGAMIYDTTLNRPIWSDSTNWRDASGTVV